MQRGRGRGRGRNPNPSRGVSRRGSRSTSRTRSTSLRRSARIAELLNDQIDGEAEPSANDTMAHVAQQRAFGRSAARSRHLSGNNRGRPNRTYLSPEDRGYAMDIVVQPPSSARAGYSINGTIIVRLRTTNQNPNAATADAINLGAVASLVPGPGSTVPTDPTVLEPLLAGVRSDNLHTLADDEADGSIASMELSDSQTVGYMRFSGLVIRQPGCYRIRITLTRWGGSSSGPPRPDSVPHLQVVDSNPIVVQASGSTAYNGNEQDDEVDGVWTNAFRHFQTRRRS